VVIAAEDEDTLRSHLSELRSEAFVYAVSAETQENPDTAALFKGIAKARLRTAQALHRLLDRAGVKALGPTSGV
jgi:hypothetical protein